MPLPGTAVGQVFVPSAQGLSLPAPGSAAWHQPWPLSCLGSPQKSCHGHPTGRMCGSDPVVWNFPCQKPSLAMGALVAGKTKQKHSSPSSKKACLCPGGLSFIQMQICSLWRTWICRGAASPLCLKPGLLRPPRPSPAPQQRGPEVLGEIKRMIKNQEQNQIRQSFKRGFICNQGKRKMRSWPGKWERRGQALGWGLPHFGSCPSVIKHKLMRAEGICCLFHTACAPVLCYSRCLWHSQLFEALWEHPRGCPGSPGTPGTGTELPGWGQALG